MLAIRHILHTFDNLFSAKIRSGVLFLQIIIIILVKEVTSLTPIFNRWIKNLMYNKQEYTEEKIDKLY